MSRDQREKHATAVPGAGNGMYACMDPTHPSTAYARMKHAMRLGFCSDCPGAQCQLGRPDAAQAGRRLIAFATWRAGQLCLGVCLAYPVELRCGICVSPETSRFAPEPTLLYTPASEQGHLINFCKLPDVI